MNEDFTCSLNIFLELNVNCFKWKSQFFSKSSSSVMPLKNMKSAREVLESMGDKVERSPSLLNLSGNIYFRQKKYAKAAEVFEKAAAVVTV